MQLRPYQQSALEKVHQAWAEGASRVCVVLPTGAGKSILAQAITEGLDALWLTPSTALREQSPGRSVTVQSLLSGHRPKCDVLIADECHHLSIAAPVWHAVATDYPRILGLTATPCHASGTGLSDLFQRLVVGANYSELVSGGYLVSCRVVRPVDVPDDESGLAQHPVESWRRYAGDRPGFAFFGRVELAEKFAREISSDRSCEVIHGGQPQELRAEIMERFRSGATTVLSSVMTLTEGVDVPAAEVCMLAVRPSHEGSYLQRVGRVLRPSPGKGEALLIDLPGASFSYGFPTDDREYSLDGEPIRRAGAALVLSQCLSCGAVYHAGPVCPVCGWERPAKVRPPRIWGAEMVELDPKTLSPEDRAKLGWKQKMLADDSARLKWLQRRAKSRGHAYVLHTKIFGAPMPRDWGRLPW